MELTYLYYFKVIAEKENMSRAAETLHVSQPALSKTISKLERSLGVTLFERKKGRISLSPVGAEFYKHVSRAFDCIDEGQRMIDAYKHSSGTSVTIGCPVSELMNTLLLHYLTENQQSSLQISQFLYTPEVLQEQLLSGKLDFALTPIPLHDPEITQIKLMDEEILLAVGRADVGTVEKLRPRLKGVEVLGGSSDHLIVDVEDCERDLKPGDVLDFDLCYATIVGATISPDVEKVYVDSDL